MRRFRRCVVLAVTTVAMLLISGCASTEPSRFYTLSSLKAQAPSAPGAISDGSLLLYVGPLFLPDYLDRPQLVNRTGSNEIQIAEFDRWAGSLKADVARVLVENLSLLLSSEPVTVLPWRAVTTSASTPDSGPQCRVVIEMTRLEGTLGEGVRLDATWGLVDREWNDMTPRRRAAYQEPVSGKDYAALVGAMSRALERLSRDIAPAVKLQLGARPRKEATPRSGR